MSLFDEAAHAHGIGRVRVAVSRTLATAAAFLAATGLSQVMNEIVPVTASSRGLVIVAAAIALLIGAVYADEAAARFIQAKRKERGGRTCAKPPPSQPSAF